MHIEGVKNKCLCVQACTGECLSQNVFSFRQSSVELAALPNKDKLELEWVKGGHFKMGVVWGWSIFSSAPGVTFHSLHKLTNSPCPKPWENIWYIYKHVYTVTCSDKDFKNWQLAKAAWKIVWSFTYKGAGVLHLFCSSFNLSLRWKYPVVPSVRRFRWGLVNAWMDRLRDLQ